MESLYEFVEKHRYPDFFTFEGDEVNDMMSKIEFVDRAYHVSLMTQFNARITP